MTFSSLVDIERRRISEELHNRLGPNLASVELNLKIIETRMVGLADQEVQQLLGESQTLLSQSVAEIRELTGELRPARLEYAGLDGALREFTQQYRRRTGVETRLAIALAPAGEEAARLDPALEWLLFRVIQEALGNCARHASAGRAEIDLRREGDLIRLQISDDGVGFDPGTIGKGERTPGLGLLEMRERVEAAQGRFSLSSRPGHGTHILVTVPVRT
jgi:signal transduction histidine kinase